nr:hypothetical protein CFP56_02571 [Quercus suber]
MHLVNVNIPDWWTDCSISLAHRRALLDVDQIHSSVFVWFMEATSRTVTAAISCMTVAKTIELMSRTAQTKVGLDIESIQDDVTIRFIPA